MADNVTLSAGTADGAVVASDDITGVHYQIVKLIIGALNAGTLLTGGAGNVDAGTVRVAIATDQTQLTNKLLVTPDLPSGASTAAKQDTAAALLTTIDADTSNLSVVGGGTEAAAIRVTIANDSTGVLSIDDNGGAITVDGTVAVTHAALTELAAAINASSQMDVNLAASGITLAISHAALTELAAAINASSQMDVNVAAALPAGNNNIGDVDVASVVPGVAATNLGKAEDAVHTSGDVGVMALAVRQDSQSDLGADGDYVPLTVTADGELRVTSSAGSGTSAADDADFTAGTTAGTPAMGVFESSPTSVTDGDLGTVGITATRALRTAVEGTVAVSNAGLTELAAAIDTELQVDVVGALPAGNNNIGDVDIASIAAGDNNIGNVDIVSGTITTVSTVTAVTTLTGSGVAHDAADSGNPHKVGLKGIDTGTQPTAVTANDRTDWYGTRNGVAWVLGGSPATLTKELEITDADGAQTDTAVITVAAGTAIVVTRVSMMMDGANTGDVGYRLGFGTANTPAADAAGIVSSHPGVKAGSGVVEGNGAGVIGMGASNEDLRLTCEDPAGGAARLVVTYHTVLIG